MADETTTEIVEAEKGQDVDLSESPETGKSENSHYPPNPSSGKNPDDAQTDCQKSDNLGEPDTFPREYVEQLRKEAADARVKVKDRDALAERLHVALVAATGRLADPTDLPFDPSYLDDADALSAAIDALVERKPHLASRRPVGDIGQGATTGAEPVSLAGILRANAN